MEDEAFPEKTTWWVMENDGMIYYLQSLFVCLFNVFYVIINWKKWDITEFLFENIRKNNPNKAGKLTLEMRSIRFEISTFGLKNFAIPQLDFFLG